MPGQEVLIVEDEIKIAEILRDYLVKAGYGVTFLNGGDKVIPHVKRNPPCLILLDIMIPGKDGMEVCREVRSFSDVPIIMITARVDEIDRLLGLELGADDYICKPFSPREVVARVKAVLRRAGAPRAQKVLTAGEISMSAETHQAYAADNELKLTPCEFNLLKTLMSRSNRIFSRSELVNVVQGYDFDGYERTIDSHIKNLRKKLAEHLPGKEVISTIYGVGYKLNAPAEE
jgi:two-component system, OmpR family, response regulator BaeR